MNPHRLITKRIKAALDATGLPWDVTHGKRHAHVRLNGRLCLVLSRCGGEGDVRGEKNSIRDIRKLERQIKDELGRKRRGSVSVAA